MACKEAAGASLDTKLAQGTQLAIYCGQLISYKSKLNNSLRPMARVIITGGMLNGGPLAVLSIDK